MHGINIIINYLSFINWYVVNEGTFALGSIRNHKAKAIEKNHPKLQSVENHPNILSEPKPHTRPSNW